MKKIALEEHFVTKDFLPSTQKSDFVAMVPSKTADFQARLLDIHDLRIAEMDKANIEIAVLSLTDPGLQGKDLNTSSAVALAAQVNDFLAEQAALRPDRFRGFAQLAMQDPQAAAKELRRCIRELHFVGALINLCALEEMGDSKVMFSADYPYESLETAAAFIENAPLSQEVREKVAYRNAKQLLKI